ncbi:hypothetical protein MGG_14662 [Pyricularia oryzae 70-15]|uniref:Secreted protein n=2 Tax=Pyricularia oryzae TaxID=318829 RepID=G4NEE0_PYRO7|nr:uncharacterized protein MGG_14662 [Pyricularia oryzae 70-15]EHA48623.1 hypothetical protein MGG_14662 [Pyricularia oryzae 70-15]
MDIASAAQCWTLFMVARLCGFGQGTKETDKKSMRHTYCGSCYVDGGRGACVIWAWVEFIVQYQQSSRRKTRKE